MDVTGNADAPIAYLERKWENWDPNRRSLISVYTKRSHGRMVAELRAEAVRLKLSLGPTQDQMPAKSG